MRKIILALVAVAVSGGFFVAYANKEKMEKAAEVAAEKPAIDASVFAKKEEKVEAKTPTMLTTKIITDAPLKTDYVLGNRKAPLVLVEYASLSCPHCAHFAKDVLPTLEKKYIETGKLAYVLRQFPLNEPALRGALLLECVGKKSEADYYKFANVLFGAQEKWAFDANFMTSLESFAKVGGVGAEAFKTCMENVENEKQVLEVKKLGNDEVKVNATPFVVIGNEVYDGAKTPEAISAFIDAKLAKLKK